MPWSGCSCEAARTAWCKGGRAPRKGVEPAHCHFVDALRSNRVLHRGADGRVLCCRFDFMHRDGWKPRIRLGTELMADFPADERAQVDANHLLSVFTSAGANLFLLTSMIISRAVGAEYDCWRMSRDVSGAFAMDPSVSFALGPEVSLTMAMHDDPADFISTRYRIVETDPFFFFFAVFEHRVTRGKLYVYLRSSGHNGGVFEHATIGSEPRYTYFFDRVPDREPIVLFDWLVAYFKRRGWLTALLDERAPGAARL